MLCPPPLYINIVNAADGYIELHNPATRAISTKGLYLSANKPCAGDECANCTVDDYCNWQMPVVIVQAGGTIQVRTAGNKNQGLKRMRTNFDLKAEGSLYLTNAKGEIFSLMK